MKVKRDISRGGFGRVEEVTLADGSSVARKTFDPLPSVKSGTDINKLRKRFKKEVLYQKSLSSSSQFFLPVLESNLECDKPWFTMPMAETTLEKFIKKNKENPEELKSALFDILNCLEELHSQDLVHRDLKPQNVLLHQENWKLCDFGLILAHGEDFTDLTSTDSAKWGSKFYCAPEQMENFKHVKPQADIYSFGCILHDIFDGSTRIPFAEHRAEGNIGFIIEKCTKKDWKRRYKNISALRNALSSCLTTSRLTLVPGDEEWINYLKDISIQENSKVDIEKLGLFVRFLNRSEVLNLDNIFRIVDEGILEKIHTSDEDCWEELASAYCEWTHQKFVFEYCDVIVKRLEKIFDLGKPSLKAEAAVAMARLGATHNRWFVMKRCLLKCSPALAESVANRIKMEILSNDESQGHFRVCASAFKGESIHSFHPLIANILLKHTNT